MATTERSDGCVTSTTFRAGEPRTVKIARLGKAASPWSRIRYKTTAIRTTRLQMLRDITAGKTPRRIR